MSSDWKETCARCMDGEIEPRHCEYYGEPNGCNSPSYGQHPTTEKSSVPSHKGRWENGTMYEYEYAYCSECGRAQWAGWDSHKQAGEEIESFASNYRYCPGCGAEMEGGVYVK